MQSAPADIDLVYWDYYHEREAGYDRMLTLHEQFSAKTVFAGGIWTWSGIAADYRKTMAVIGPALRMCLKHGVREVFATAWGDNGGECPFSTILLGLQAYAEFDYAGTLDEAHLMRRFAQCAGADGQAFLRIGELHHPFEREKPERGVVNVCKPLLYEDPLIPLFERDFAGESMQAHYAALQMDFLRYAAAAPQALQPMLRMYEALAEALRLKCVWRDSAAAAVRTRDREAARALLDVANANVAALTDLADRWRSAWMAENKPFGFEVVDARVGGVIARFHSAKARMQAFADGELATFRNCRAKSCPASSTATACTSPKRAGVTWSPPATYKRPLLRRSDAPTAWLWGRRALVSHRLRARLLVKWKRSLYIICYQQFSLRPKAFFVLHERDIPGLNL